MFQIAGLVTCLLLFALSLLIFSKSAEQRARVRTELFYAEQIREEAKAIRLHNEKIQLENNLEMTGELNDIKDCEVISEDCSSEPIKEEVHKLPNHEVKLKEVDLDDKALEFLSNFQPKQEEIKFQEVRVYEKPKAWFNFREVDLHMNERPEKGLYYISGKVIDVLDDMSAIISDGTGERMLYHHKVQSLSVGDIIISQVEIYKHVWNFVKVWEINEPAKYKVEEAF